MTTKESLSSAVTTMTIGGPCSGIHVLQKSGGKYARTIVKGPRSTTSITRMMEAKIQEKNFSVTFNSGLTVKNPP